MSEDGDIRDTLRDRLGAVRGDSVIPNETLLRAHRRRRHTIAAATLGGLASVLIVFVALQAMELPRPTADVDPASTPTPSESSPAEDEEVSTRPGDLDSPPPVTIKAGDRITELSAWSYCYNNGCVSGAPPDDPPSIGSPQEVVVNFPDEEWSFTATFTPADDECGRQQQVRLERTPEGEFLLHPAGHAGAYDVTLFGRGDGSLSVTFRWFTPADGPLPEPEGRAAIITDQSGHPYSYGVEVELVNLAETPDQASATVTVEAADGDSITFEAERAIGRCLPDGTAYWEGPDAKGTEAADLGSAPFDYTIDFVLDGSRYVGTGTWPADEIRGNEPSISLEFSPQFPEQP